MSGDNEDELFAIDLEVQEIEAKILQLQDKKKYLLKRKDKLKNDALLQKSEALANRNWERSDFPWSEKVTQLRKSVFKLSEFRQHQLPTINAVLSKEDAILLMPTGGGKSLCYQLPALINSGFTLVVSPLLALMEDQIIALKALNVNAALLSSNSTKEHNKEILKLMIEKKTDLKLLYVTPERLAKSKMFMSKLQKSYIEGNLSMVAIDEVHCCSQWGHDFRPDYKYLGVLKAMFPEVPILGVTATATTSVLLDVQKMLSIQGCLVIKAHFNRPNLYYEVREKPTTAAQCVEELAKLLSSRFPNQTGIIYTTSIKECEDLEKELNSWKKGAINVGCYHAQLDANQRTKVHLRWLRGEIQAVVATVAFGLGIDKPNVRFVIHHSMSKSMETYYQESGRAGRDGENAECIMFYQLTDVMKISTMVYDQRVAIEKLYRIVDYCLDQTRCRRAMIASQFEEKWESEDCLGMCDHCRHPREEKKMDVTEHCRALLHIIQRSVTVKKKVTVVMLVDTWFEKGSAELRVPGATKPAIARKTAEDIVAFLLAHNYLKEDFHITAYRTYAYIKLGPRSSSVLARKDHVILMPTRGKSLPNSFAGASGKSKTAEGKTDDSVESNGRLQAAGVCDSSRGRDCSGEGKTKRKRDKKLVSENVIELSDSDSDFVVAPKKRSRSRKICDDDKDDDNKSLSETENTS